MKSTQEVKEVKEPINTFEPIKLDVNFDAYAEANQQAEALLNNFNDALSSCGLSRKGIEPLHISIYGFKSSFCLSVFCSGVETRMYFTSFIVCFVLSYMQIYVIILRCSNFNTTLLTKWL